jgi:DNA-binding MarR family transcriptional regulator
MDAYPADRGTGVGEPDYGRLAAFRRSLRGFLRWSEQASKDVGLTPMQHQLLLAVRGRGGAPTIREIADDLMVRHHSAGELIDRAEAAGLVARTPDVGDRRQTRVRATGAGNRLLRRLSTQHLSEIRRLAPIVEALARDL